MNSKKYASMVLLLLITTGCGTAVSPESHPAIDGAPYLLSEEPAGAAGVMDVREKAKDQESVVLVGRVGGAENPWVEGRAAFSVIDPGFQVCDDGEGFCACCVDDMCNSTALVKIVDENGKLVKADARKLLNIKENELVVVAGKALRDEAGNLTVHARGIYVRR